MSNAETTLHFFCGKMAAGKSTLAKTLSQQHQAILLCEDQWLSQLYPGKITSIADYIEYSDYLKNILSEHIQSLLKQGISVVLDFPGNTKSQRCWFVHIFEQTKVAHRLHFIDVSDELCKLQLKQRSRDKPKGTAFTSTEDFDAITQYFQAPSDDEKFTIIRYER